MTQQLAILKYLREGHALSPLEALDKFGCMRLAAVVKDLRNQGYEIETDMIRNGNGKRYAQYTLHRQAGARREFWD